MRAFLLDTPAADAYAQMALDEALLNLAAPETCVLRFYRWPGTPVHAVTFGYSQSYAEVEATVRRRLAGIAFPLVRRSTGGGIVYHDGDVTFSFVFPWPRLTAPSLIYKDLHMGVHLGLKAQLVRSRLWAATPPRPKSAAECFAGPDRMDLVGENGRKLLGGALRRRRGFGLYQGSFRVEEVDPEKVRRAVAEGLSLQWRVLFEPLKAPDETQAAAKALERERYRSELWNRRR